MLILFIPQRQGCNRQMLADVGLDSLLVNTHAPMAADGVGDATPSKTTGVFWYFGDPCTQLYHKGQTWIPAKADPQRGLAAGRYWFCLEGQATPQSLARPDQLESIGVTLDDGQEWLVPIARELPGSWALDAETGEVVKQPAERFADYCRLADRFMHLVVNERGRLQSDLLMRDAWRLAVLGLEVNYYMSREIMDALGLVRTDDTMFLLVGASFELQRMPEYMAAISAEKKTAGGTRATSNS